MWFWLRKWQNNVFITLGYSIDLGFYSTIIMLSPHHMAEYRQWKITWCFLMYQRYIIHLFLLISAVWHWRNVTNLFMQLIKYAPNCCPSCSMVVQWLIYSIPSRKGLDLNSNHWSTCRQVSFSDTLEQLFVSQFHNSRFSRIRKSAAL